MTAKEMEAELLRLSEEYTGLKDGRPSKVYKGGRDPEVQARYQALHARWMALRVSR
jgi:hypothetical protein